MAYRIRPCATRALDSPKDRPGLLLLRPAPQSEAMWAQSRGLTCLAQEHQSRSLSSGFAFVLMAVMLLFSVQGSVRTAIRVTKLSSATWTSIGPFGVSALGFTSNLTTSGPVDAIGYSPADPNTIYTGAGPFSPDGVLLSGSLGLWKSTDSGQTWNLMPGLSSSRI